MSCRPSIAFSQFLDYCRIWFVRELENEKDLFLNDLSLSEKEIMQEQINSPNRKHTFAFNYPRKGHIYIELKSRLFAKFVCFWIGSVHDRWILHSASRKCPFKSFQENDSLSILYDSGEEARIGEDTCEGPDDNFQYCSRERALLENYTSSNGLEIEYKDDANPDSGTWVR